MITATSLQLVVAAVIVLAAVVLAMILRRLLVRLLDRGDADTNAGRLTGRLVTLVVLAVGIVYAFSTLGIQLGPLLGALGVGGLALAIALQDILQNFVAGVLLQVRRPFRVGDQVGLGDFEGKVVDVNLRTVELSGYDGVVVYLPNSRVTGAPIINYTRTPHSRTTLSVGVAYDTDLERAREVLLAACASAGGAEQTPPPEVWVEAFGDSAIDLAIRYWHHADIASRWRVRSTVAVAVKSALDEAGIDIAFPQRTLWFGPGGTDLNVRHDGPPADGN